VQTGVKSSGCEKRMAWGLFNVGKYLSREIKITTCTQESPIH
jgi:hypothetical protein